MTVLFFLQVFFYGFGAVAGFALQRFRSWPRIAGHLLAAAGSLSGVFYSLALLFSKQTFALEFTPVFPLGSLRFECDLISGFFVFVISFLSFLCSVYAISYTEEHESKKSIPFLVCFYNLFILSMILVVQVQNAFYFLIFWELMSLASYFLVIFEHEESESRRAGLIYFVMTHIGTALITAAFLLLFTHSGSLSFEAFKASQSTLPESWRSLIFLLALFGFGTKAGLVPLHIWLPKAHPQAPSHVSALMSGVMIKTAVYGFLRVLFHFLGGHIPDWWGTVIVTVAIVTVLVGILYALMEHDLKKLLAYSSIENIGIVFLNIGMAVIFMSTAHPHLAAFALAACFYHVLNHAIFKGLLFLGAGSVLFKTHTRNLEQLGGLIKRMPVTANCFLIGALSISALPPFNGFVSEWMTFLSVLSGMQMDHTSIRFFSPVVASLLGLAGALVAMCFIKVLGIGFLGMPRSQKVAQATEVPWLMQAPMAFLAAMCLACSLAAPWLVRWFTAVTNALLSTHETFTVHSFGTLIPPSGLSFFSPLAVCIGLAAILLLFIGLAKWMLRKTETAASVNWDCGVAKLAPSMQYSATGYSKPLRRIFSFLYQPARKVEIETEGHILLRTAKHFESHIHPFFEEMFYRPVLKWVLTLSRKAKRMQTGHIQLYLSYIFITLLLLLIYLRVSK